MIVCHDAEGRITNIYHDPVPDGMAEHLRQVGIPFVAFDSREKASDVARDWYVADGAVTPRPKADVRVSVDGMAIAIENLPAGTQAGIILDAGTPHETRHAVEVDGSAAAIALDEAGPVRLVVRPPWPYLETVHDIDL